MRGRHRQRAVIIAGCSGAMCVSLVAVRGTVTQGDPPLGTTLINFFQAGSQPSTEDVVYEPFQGSDNCKLCHEFDKSKELTDIYPKWAGSMMAQSARDPVFRAGLVIANQDAASSGDLCLRCHVPAAWLEGRSDPSDGSMLLDRDRDGINCHVCHRMVDPVLRPTSPFPDESILANIDPVPIHPGGGSFIMDTEDRRRGPFELPGNPGHTWLESPYHSTSALCGTCHDVSNPFFVRQEDGSYAPNTLGQPHPTGNKYDMFPEQRTYSEWLASDFANGGVDMDGRFGGPLDTVVGTCQDCHMPDNSSEGCLVPGFPARDNMPVHEFAGANSWVRDAVYNLYPEDNLNLAYLQAGQAAARSMLERACTLTLSQAGNHLVVRVTNETGHKLPTGYPEGRRMWIEVAFFDAKLNLLGDCGYYDSLTRTLDAHNTKVYRSDQGLDQAVADVTGFSPGPSAHLVLNNKIYFDNRIPPRGFTNAGFDAVQAAPVGATYADGQYWDDTVYAMPPGTVSVEVRVFHQTTTREYAEFLRDETYTNVAVGQAFYEQWDLLGGSPPVQMAEAVLLPEPFPDGDANGDLVVNLADAFDLSVCLSAPGGGLVEPFCADFDFDADGDVDLRDASEFAEVFGQ